MVAVELMPAYRTFVPELREHVGLDVLETVHPSLLVQLVMDGRVLHPLDVEPCYLYPVVPFGRRDLTHDADQMDVMVDLRLYRRRQPSFRSV